MFYDALNNCHGDKMKIVDLFAGCGGLSLGFQNAGYEIVAAYENWSVAAQCYRNNFDHPVFEVDLSNVAAATKHIKKHAPDMIIGGPPCQDFSQAGTRSEGSRASLTSGFAQIINNIKPTWFLMENVDRAYSSKAYAEAKKILHSAGYGLTERVLNASYCGVPQKRKRLFCIGLLGAEDNFMGDLIDGRVSKEPMTVRQYLGDELGLDYYYRHPRNYSRRGIFSIDEPAPTIRGVNRPIPKGYTGHAGDPIEIGGALRPLTTTERARLQTFPPQFKWQASKTDLEQIIGNAVPVKLAEFIASSITAYTTKSTRKKKAA
jgi:DNA (cytosine-5)-methyltransferase 1